MAVINDFLIISDFDGTFIDFEKKVDKKIIEELFKFNPFVIAIDSILWRINDLGIIGNSMGGLKLRLYIYSIFTIFGKHLKYKYIFKEYESKYKKLAFKEYQKKHWIINCLTEKKYDFLLLTNNKFASELKISNSNIIYTTNKRKYLKNNIPKFLLGDNFWDDYRNCPKTSTYVNIGTKSLIYKIKPKKAICLEHIEEIAFI